MTHITEEILKELGFSLVDNKWVHEKGTFIYVNKMPEDLATLVNIMNGTAFKIGKQTCK